MKIMDFIEYHGLEVGTNTRVYAQKTLRKVENYG